MDPRTGRRYLATPEGTRLRRVVTKVPESIVEQLRADADARGITMSAALAEVVARGLDRREEALAS